MIVDVIVLFFSWLKDEIGGILLIFYIFITKYLVFILNRPSTYSLLEEVLEEGVGVVVGFVKNA